MLLLLLACSTQNSDSIPESAQDDIDGDGLAWWEGDCMDTDASIGPQAAEIPDNGVDEDCDGLDRETEEIGGIQLTGAWEESNAGYSLASGDLNGDGQADLVVGAPNVVDGNWWAAAFVVHGPILERGSLAEAVQFTGLPKDGSHTTGHSVAIPGDLTGDGLADLVYAIPGAEGEASQSGVVYVVEGPAEVGNDFVAPTRSIVGAVPYANLGVGMTSAGDVNEDGVAELLLGSFRSSADPGYDGDVGRILLFQGLTGARMTEADASCTLLGEEATYRTGESIASGDFNGDGLTDVLAGAWDSDPRGEKSGKAWVVYGPLSGTQELAEADAHLLGEHAGDYAGQTVANAGDVDGDGVADLFVGTYLAEKEGERSGRGYLLTGAPAGTRGLEEATAIFTSVGAEDRTARAMTAAGDLNADGYGEVLIGSPQPDSFQPDRFARVSLYYGPLAGTISPASAGRIWVSPEYNDAAGASLLANADLTGDGVRDLVVGAPNSNQAATRSGTVYLMPLED